jgi:hypothetical protein
MEQDLEEREEQIRKARLMLWAALISGLIAVHLALLGMADPLLPGLRPLLVRRALGRARRGARHRHEPAGDVPGARARVRARLHLLPIAYFLLRSYQALEPGGAPEEPAPRPQAARPAASRPATAVKAGPATGIRGAVACVKNASLGGQVPEGESLTARITQPGIDMKAEDLPVMRATKGHFAVCYLIDEGAHYSFASHGQMKAAGLTLEELHRIALGNLAALMGAKPGLGLHSGSGHHGLTMGGQFEASLVLLDSLWDRTLAEHFPNGPWWRSPRATCCSSATRNRARAGAPARRRGARDGGGDHLLTEKLFVRAGGKWSEFGAETKKDLPPLEFGR